MAMTGISKRSIDLYLSNSLESKGEGGVGPGSYEPKNFNKGIAYQNTKAPPFNCNDIKWSPEKVAIKKNIPGPGAYNIRSDMNTGKVIALNMDKRTYFIQDANNAQNRMAAFGNSDRKERFEVGQKEPFPGPGAYDQDSHFDKIIEIERVRRKKQGSNSIVPTLTNNATSNTSLNLKELQTSDSHHIDHLIKQGPVFETSTTSNSRIMKLNSSKASFISPKKDESNFSRAQRKLALPGNHNPKLGPGSYFKDAQLNKFAKTSKNISALTTDGSTIGRLGGNRNHTENLKKRRNANRFGNTLRNSRKQKPSISANFHDSDSEVSASDHPGPGSYYNSANVTTFRDKSENNKFQYFGTTSPRFTDPNTSAIPGPGTYNEKVEIPRKTQEATSVFKNERRIETVFEKYISPAPGPGKYNCSKSDFVPRKNYKKKKGDHFISAERRFFHEPEYIKNPGPGKYFDKKDPMAIQAPNTKFDANFGSKSNRKIEEFLVMHENSPMYNLQDHDAINRKKSTTRAPNNFTIMYKKEAPFLTSSPRFRQDEMEPITKSDRQNSKNSLLNKLISEALRQRIPRMPFNQSDERFKAQIPKEKLPGPGAYNAEKDKWHKQTFNLRFIK